MKSLFCSHHCTVLRAPCWVNLVSSRTWNQLWDWAEGGSAAKRWTALDTLVPCPLSEGLWAAERAVCSALSSGSCSNPWSAEQNHLQRLKNAAISPISPPDPFAMTCPKKSASILLCRDLNADEKILLLLGAIPLPKLFPLHAEVTCLGNTRPASHPTGVISTGVSGHWVP